MSEQLTPRDTTVNEDAGSESTDGGSPVVGKPQDGPNGRSKKALLFFVLIGVILIVAIIVCVLLLRHKPKPISAKSNVASSTAKQPIGVQISEMQNQGKPNQAIQKLNSQIAQATTNDQKGQLYELEAETYLDENDYKDALKTAQMASSLSPTANSAQLMAESEAGLGDKTAAIQDYQKAATRYANSGDSSSVQSMQAAAKALGSS